MTTPSKTEHHDYLSEFEWISHNEKKCRFIIFLTLSMMLVELVFGYATHSMALLADGWHMGSHAGALFITYLTYIFAKSKTLHKRFSFGTGKFIPLGGYTNALLLGVMAVWMLIESTYRLVRPELINYDEALAVSIVGLIVNLASLAILGKNSHFHQEENSSQDDHDHEHAAGHSHDNNSHHADHNMKSAYFHVLADAMTSVLAIVALFLGKRFQAPWLDAAIGIVGGLILLKWSYSLIKDTAWELLDGHSRTVSRAKLTAKIEAIGAGTEVLDLHIWSIGPHVNACEVILKTKTLRGPGPYKKLLEEKYGFRHTVVEEWQA